MVKKKLTIGKVFLGGILAGGTFGLLNIKPDDSVGQGIEKIGAPALVGGAVAVILTAGNRAHNKIRPKPSQKELEDAERYAREKNKEYLRDSAEDRYKRQQGNGDKER
jgi:hypothetical protein